MTHTTEDIERIAKGLTKAQREAVLISTPHGCVPRSIKTIQSLSRKGMAHRLTPWQSSMNWTPLGLTVRAHLIAQDGKGG